MYPNRIVALSAEITEIIYEIGAQEQLIGISGYSAYPEEARKEKIVVSAFQDVRMDKIAELNPDLIIGFSDVQAPFVGELGKMGYNVVLFNQRSIAEIFQVILQVGGLTGHLSSAHDLVSRLKQKIETVRVEAAKLPERPKVYFEEWYSPLVSGIGWISELIAIAGGQDVFQHKSHSKAANGRVVQPAEVLEANPDLIVASWCGKRFVLSRMTSRDGWERIKAIQSEQVYEIPSRDILAPGVAAIERGLVQLHEMIKQSIAF